MLSLVENLFFGILLLMLTKLCLPFCSNQKHVIWKPGVDTAAQNKTNLVDVISEPTMQWMKYFTTVVSGWYHPKCFRNRDSFSWGNHLLLSSQTLFWKGLTIRPFWSPVLKSYDLTEKSVLAYALLQRYKDKPEKLLSDLFWEKQ